MYNIIYCRCHIMVIIQASSAFALWATADRQAEFIRGYSIMVVRDLPKVEARVRFPLPAPSYAKASDGKQYVKRI